MRIMKKLSFNLVVICLFLCCAASAFASPTVTISSSANGKFSLQGTGFDGVGGATITISYDPKTLVNPRVTQGGLTSGALLVANTTTPGSIRVVFVTGDPKGIVGDGLLATISFDLVGKSPGVVQLLTADLVNPKGVAIDAQAQGANPAGGTPQPSDGSSSPTQGSGTSATANPAQPSSTAATGTSPNLVGGQLTMPAEGEPAQEKKQDESASASAAPQKESAAAPGAATTVSGSSPEALTSASGVKPGDKTVRYKGVLEQFRAFEGVKTPAALIALFNQNAMPEIRQEPAIALSDGTGKVNVYINRSGSGKEAPSFNLQGAQLVSLKMGGEHTWLLEVLPIKGVYRATITIIQNGAETEIPLTVAPPIATEMKAGTGGKPTEADFNLFLKEQGTKKAPRFDLNGDGVRDYIDDFIFTANYLATRSSAPKVHKPGEK